MKSNTTRIAGYVLSGLMALMLLNSSYFFLMILKLSLARWLAFNACSIAIIVYLICFILFLKTKRTTLLAIPLLPLYYYGTMGLFTMSWNEVNIFAQITHIVITANILWVLYLILKGQEFESLGKGCLAGILVFVPVFALIQSYTNAHMDEFMKVLQSM